MHEGGRGTRLNSLGVLLQINKDATIALRGLSFPICLMQFPYLLSGDVILFQSDSPSPPLTRSLSLPLPRFVLSARPFRKKKKGGGQVGSRDAGEKRGEDGLWLGFESAFPG